MISLIPTPKEYTICNDRSCVFAPYIFTEEPAWTDAVCAFSDSFRRLHGIALRQESGGILLKLNQALHEGAYTLESDCENHLVTVCASGIEGIQYALASLIQLIDCKNHMLCMSDLSLKDYPDKEYRALMVDLGRMWHPFDKLLKYVDLCCLYKIRYLHLHFVDFGLYTLPSKAFPRLSDPNTCYTYEQIEKLNAYAKARGIIIIPEYECPGHASVMVERYPEEFGNHYSAEKSGYPWNSVMCAGSEASFHANKILLKEISDLFPDSPYIHIGGDEASIECWDECADCRAYMADRGIENVHGLYSDFIARIAEYVFTLGKTPIVWEGFPADGADKIPKNTIVIAWESLYQTADQLLAEGFRIINASWKPLYVVPSMHRTASALDIMKWNVYNWQNYSTKSKAFLNPINIAPTDQVLGCMLCAWEQTFEREIRPVMENLCAMSERSWNIKRMLSDDEFLKKAHHLIHLAERIIQDR